jgi:hypothetical protein
MPNTPSSMKKKWIQEPASWIPWNSSKGAPGTLFSNLLMQLHIIYPPLTSFSTYPFAGKKTPRHLLSPRASFPAPLSSSFLLTPALGHLRPCCCLRRRPALDGKMSRLPFLPPAPATRSGVPSGHDLAAQEHGAVGGQGAMGTASQGVSPLSSQLGTTEPGLGSLSSHGASLGMEGMVSQSSARPTRATSRPAARRKDLDTLMHISSSGL